MLSAGHELKIYFDGDRFASQAKLFQQRSNACASRRFRAVRR